jgi:hypothetical protein
MCQTAAAAQFADIKGGVRIILCGEAHGYYCSLHIRGTGEKPGEHSLNNQHPIIACTPCLCMAPTNAGTNHTCSDRSDAHSACTSQRTCEGTNCARILSAPRMTFPMDCTSLALRGRT